MVGVYYYKIATRYTALNDYIPIAPTDDEAKKHNENLPLKSTLEQISEVYFCSAWKFINKSAYRGLRINLRKRRFFVCGTHTLR